MLTPEWETTAIPKPDGRLDGERTIPTLTILCHPDLQRVGDRVFLFPLAQGGKLALSRTTPDFTPPLAAIGRPLSDVFVSREPIRLQAKDGGVLIDKGRSQSELTVDGSPMTAPEILSEARLDTGVVLGLAGRIVLWLHLAKTVAIVMKNDHGLVGFSDSIQFVREEIERVADLRTPVLLSGASGTGKELVARAIHQAGSPGRPFVGVNMGAIPATLAASELFGALKGSFTGADRNRVGYFQAAQGGTLFLDEVGEAPPEVQVLLLRVLESGEMTPVGSQTPLRVNVRLIAATDADLAAKIEEDSFKAPLFHRLAGYEITLPPLRERMDDFGRLFLHFAREELVRIGDPHLLTYTDPHAEPWLPADLVTRLARFSWPGNVRQLRNIVWQSIIGCRGETRLRLVPKVAELLADPIPHAESPPATLPATPGRPRMPAPAERQNLVAALRANRWEIKATAAQLGISRSTLYEWMDRTTGIRRAGALSAEEIHETIRACEGHIEAAAEALQVPGRSLRRRMTELGIG